MSDRDGGAVDGHLTDEELSDLVDGVGSPEALDHASGCPSCRTRLDQWDALAARLRSAPVPVPPDGRRDDAVRAAMAAAGAAGAGASAMAEDGTPVSPRSGPPAGWRGRRNLAGLAAAAVLVVAAGVGLSQLHGSRASSSRTASGGTASVAGGGGARPSSAQAARLPNLGSLDGAPALIAAVNKALPPSGAGASDGGSFSTAAGPASPGVAGAAAGTTIPTSGTGRVYSGPSAATPQPLRSPVAGTAPLPPTATTVPGSCAIPAGLFAAGSPPALLLEATADYRTVPSEVFVFQVSGERRAVVLASHGCRVLAQVKV